MIVTAQNYVEVSRVVEALESLADDLEDFDQPAQTAPLRRFIADRRREIDDYERGNTA